MKTTLTLLLLILVGADPAFAQASGNVAYGQSNGKAKAELNERNKRTLAPAEFPPSSTTMFVDASVLMNVKADEYVVVFGIAQDGATVDECHREMDATVEGFSAALRPLGIGPDDVFVDFAAQEKIYGYQVEGNLAREHLVGFELKKNISIHYRDKSLLDKLVIAASGSKVFDLIKVDYVVKDIEPIQDRLMEEAARIVKRKAARHEKLLGIGLKLPPQVYAEKASIHHPTEMYDSYTAYEAESIDRDQVRSKYAVQGLRKSRTFFFNALNADGFDHVINPVVIEPVVQCTFYLKLKYEIEAGKGPGTR